jgi:hypothetical protein
MEIFRGLQVKTGVGKDGVEKYIDVPVAYGSKDRVTAAILAGNTQNKPLRLPTMSAYLQGIALANDRFKGIDTERKTTYMPRGGLFPDDVTMIIQLMPVPYRLTMQLAIYSSNINTHLQILEQILILFNPSIQIQTSDAAYDQGKITTVELKDIGMEENYPIGADRRIITSQLTFDIIMYLTAPTQVRDEAIRNIRMRIGHLSILANFAEVLYDFDLEEEKLNFTVTVDEINATDIFPSEKI